MKDSIPEIIAYILVGLVWFAVEMAKRGQAKRLPKKQLATHPQPTPKHQPKCTATQATRPSMRYRTRSITPAHTFKPCARARHDSLSNPQNAAPTTLGQRLAHYSDLKRAIVLETLLRLRY